VSVSPSNNHHLVWFRPGESVKRGCNTCTCVMGRLKCTKNNCTESVCKANQKVLDNVSQCKLTCGNFDRMDPNRCAGGSYRGCGCDEGLVLNVRVYPPTPLNPHTHIQGDMCVKSDACPCYHAGKFYDSGVTMTRDCNRW
jgi:hypothetical protein